AGILLSPDTVVDHGLEKWMTCSSPKCIVSNFPVHPIVVPQKSAKSKAFKRKHTPKLRQARQAGRQHNIQIKVETAVSIDGQVPEEIKSLYRILKRIKDGSVFGAL